VDGLKNGHLILSHILKLIAEGNAIYSWGWHYQISLYKLIVKRAGKYESNQTA